LDATEYLILRQGDCKDCYKCIRNCPVKSVKFENERAEIIGNECILCGRCYVACPQQAKEIRSDLEAVRRLIDSGEEVVASVAPSFIAGFDADGIGSMRCALQRLGFSDVEETAVGADFVSREYEKLMAAGSGALISSCCPSVNLLIQKYYPDMLDCLAPVLSPMRAHCRAIKAARPDAKAVFIGPCISKKYEADEEEAADACLTFDELRRWMGEAGVSFEPGGEEAPRLNARSYPTVGGILRTLKPGGYEAIAIDGAAGCIAALEELRTRKGERVFLEMSACEGGCVGGPVIREHARRVAGALRVARYAGQASPEGTPPEDMALTFPRMPLLRVQPGGEAIQQVLNRMGKTTKDRELNCGSCGYPTCRDKAVAVCRGRAEIGMCLPFLKEKAESFSDQIIRNTPNAILVMDEHLIVQQVNRAALELFRLKSPDDILRAPAVRVMDPTNLMRVVSTGAGLKEELTYLAEYGRYVKQTLLYDRQYRILIAILRDVTERETKRGAEQALRRKACEVTDQVVEKQMRVVQEIASLLGETTAETKLALARLKDAMQNE
jgi:iron only hydrogenase large subunit-like protein